MDKAMKLFKSRQFFTTWFGVGIPPFLFGTVYSAYLISLSWGIITAVIIVFWIHQTFRTTCRRCQYYGTTKCGLPGIIAPYLYKKESPFSISLKRIKIHYYFDLALIIYVNIIYAHFPTIYPMVAIGSLVGYLIVFRNKRFHGLLWRLKEEDAPKVMNEVKIPIYKIERAPLRDM